MVPCDTASFREGNVRKLRLVTHVDELSDREVLEAYKKQPLVEKRFEQLKTDFKAAPVYLKEVRRIRALLCVYFLVVLVEALLEREMRRAMHRKVLKPFRHPARTYGH